MFTQFITEEEEEAVLPAVCVSPEADHNFYNLTYLCTILYANHDTPPLRVHLTKYGHSVCKLAAVGLMP